jgi:hypothetical protein
MKLIINLLFALLFLSSCSTTLDFHVPTQNFMTPEVVGKSLGIRTQTTFSNTTKFRLAKLEQAKLFSSSIRISTEEGTTKDNTLNFTGGVGIGNALEVTYRSYRDSPDLIGVKAQILGRDGGKRQEGVKLSIHGGYGSSEVDNKTLTATDTSGTTRSYNSVLDVEGFEFGGVIGYRLSDKFLPYFSYNYRHFEANGNLTSDSFTNQSIDGVAKVQSLQFGVDLTVNTLHILLESGYANSRWRELEQRDDYTLGLSIGFTTI